MLPNTIGADNIAIGYEALSGNTTGSNNIAVGLTAGLILPRATITLILATRALLVTLILSVLEATWLLGRRPPP
jgi:hypothetical protein